MIEFVRVQKIVDAQEDSVFLWGARQVGKSTLIKNVYPNAKVSESDEQLSYWRTANGYEVDAVIGEGRIAIEFKSTEEVQSKHTKGLKAFSEEYANARLIVVSMDVNPRMLNGVEILPAMDFLKLLWEGKIC